MSARVLAGDIGGTNARFAIVEVDGSDARIVHEARYPSRSAPGLSPLVIRYLAGAGERPEVACLGIACPVINGDCEATNRIEIQATGRLVGNIRAPKIVIAEGAMFRGNSDMSGRRDERRTG
jgi:glucokinase